jgi:ABC-type glycerol-3-phosphate transport system substrate-binding protein
MKARLVLMSSLLVLAGCGDKSTSSTTTNTTSSSGSPLTAPVDYLAAAAKAQQSAVKTVDVTSLDKAIQLFNVDQGRNPKDLNELVPKYIPQMPVPPYGTKLVYDANAGKVTVVKE